MNGKGGSGVGGVSVINFLSGIKKLKHSRVKHISIGRRCTFTTVEQGGLGVALGAIVKRGVGNVGAVVRGAG